MCRHGSSPKLKANHIPSIADTWEREDFSSVSTLPETQAMDFLVTGRVLFLSFSPTFIFLLSRHVIASLYAFFISPFLICQLSTLPLLPLFPVFSVSSLAPRLLSFRPLFSVFSTRALPSAHPGGSWHELLPPRNVTACDNMQNKCGRERWKTKTRGALGKKRVKENGISSEAARGGGKERKYRNLCMERRVVKKIKRKHGVKEKEKENKNNGEKGQVTMKESKL